MGACFTLRLSASGILRPNEKIIEQMCRETARPSQAAGMTLSR